MSDLQTRILEIEADDDTGRLARALEAVMEMHKPLNVGGIDGDHLICEVCVTINGYGGWDQRDHPCETYKAITDAMGDSDA